MSSRRILNMTDKSPEPGEVTYRARWMASSDLGLANDWDRWANKAAWVATEHAARTSGDLWEACVAYQEAVRHGSVAAISRASNMILTAVDRLQSTAAEGEGR